MLDVQHGLQICFIFSVMMSVIAACLILGWGLGKSWSLKVDALYYNVEWEVTHGQMMNLSAASKSILYIQKEVVCLSGWDRKESSFMRSFRKPND